MGLRCVKPAASETTKPPGRIPECKIVVHGTEFYSTYNVMSVLTSGKVAFAGGWSPDETSPEKYVKIFPWSYGGRCDNRAIFRHHEVRADAIIFVIDDTETNLNYANDILQMLLSEEGLKNSVLVIVHNDERYHCDTNAERTTLDEVKKVIDLDSIPKSYRPTILPCCSKTGEGMDEVIGYLTKTLLSDKRYNVDKIPEVKPEVNTASIVKQVETTLKDTKPNVPESA